MNKFVACFAALLLVALVNIQGCEGAGNPDGPMELDPVMELDSKVGTDGVMQGHKSIQKRGDDATTPAGAENATEAAADAAERTARPLLLVTGILVVSVLALCVSAA
ncbi:hypothetical protein O0L34_g2244 [Tuta absoluta]|nr:hypothetical protein O0L34_g2244 [Tuta absoluta]